MTPAHSGGRAAPDVGSGGRVVTRTRAAPDVSFSTFYSAWDPPRVHWGARDGLEFAGVGAAVRVAATGEGRIESVRRASTQLFDGLDHDGPPVARPRLVGGLSFDAVEDAAGGDGAGGDGTGYDACEVDDASATDDAGAMDDASEMPVDPWDAFPDALFVLPRLQLVRHDDRTWLSATAYDEGASTETVEDRLDDALERLEAAAPTRRALPPGVRRTRIRPDRDTWTDAVAATIDRIGAGELEKLVLATAMDVDLAGEPDVPGVLERVGEQYPDCYRLLVQPDADAAFLGPPPERLVKLDGTEVRTEALAGSIGRGDTPEADEERARALRSDDKRQHEQQLVVDAIRERLAGFGEVTEHEQRVRRLATIQHLRTPITASLSEPAHVLDLVAALHPTPAVGGLPRQRALQAIRETEPFDRGWYAAPVGWIDGNGDGEFTVAIRTGMLSDDGARLFAGNGIVADSDPDEEWAEIEPKFRPILDALT